MTDFLLALASFAGLLVYASIAVAVYRWGTSPDGDDCDVFQRLGTVLACCVFEATGIIFAVSQLRFGPGGDGTWVALAIFGGMALLCVPFGSAVAYELFDGWAGRAALWPLAIPLSWVVRVTVVVVVVLARAVTFGSRGPLALGTWLAELPGRRERARVARDQEVGARRQRIAAMEKELGL